MKTDVAEFLVASGRSAPVVEIDTEAGAAYVRFQSAKVARTVRHNSKWPIITLDLNARDEVIGVEFVGVKRFDLAYLLKQIRLKASAGMVARASYVSAESEAAPGG